MRITKQLIIISLFYFTSTTAYAADYEATIKHSKPFELSLPVSGVIKKVNVVAGQAVTKGDELLSLNKIPFQALKSQAEALVTIKKTALTRSTRDLKNRQELFDRTVLSTIKRQNSELDVKRDKALLKDAKAQLALANYNLTTSKLLAPFNALILSVSVNQGQAINNTIQNKTLITLVKNNQYHVEFFISDDVFEKIKIDQIITIQYKKTNYQGKISSIILNPKNSENNKDKRYRIKANFKLTAKHSPIGYKANIQLN